MSTTSQPLQTRRVFRTVLHCEWRLVRSDLSWWAAIGMLLACVCYSLHNGHVRLAERAAAIADAQRDEADRLANLTKQLERIESGEAKAPSAPYRDPRNAIYVGRGSAATVAYLPDAPLAATAIGVSDLYPHVFKVSAGSQDSFLFVDEIANPTHLLSGSFDLAFVIVYLFPLLLLSLSYNVLSAEREQGTLALTAASSASLLTVLVGKLTIRAGSLIAVTIAGIGLHLLSATWLSGAPQAELVGTGGLAAFLLLSIAIVVYGSFWLALALWVNGLRRDSAFNAVALIMTWVLLLLVAPAAMNATAQGLHPAPARSEMVLAVRNAAIDTERDRDATEARYREEHRNSTSSTTPSTDAPKPDERSQRTLAITLAADARADAVLAQHEVQVQAQRRLSDRMAFLVPPALINEIIAELAGNGHTRWDDYLARVGRFHATWQEFFVSRAQRGNRLTRTDYDVLPRFNALEKTAELLSMSTPRVLQAMVWIAAISIGLLLASARRFSRAIGV